MAVCVILFAMYDIEQFDLKGLPIPYQVYFVLSVFYSPFLTPISRFRKVWLKYSLIPLVNRKDCTLTQ